MKRIFIGIPILNRLDLLYKCIGALDYPSEVIIINNNSADAEFKSQLDSFAKAKGLTVLHQQRNLGVAASWNLIIRTALAKCYDSFFIGSNDTILRPGSLKAAVDFNKADHVGIWHLNAFNFFLIRKTTIDRVGWFDENFYPAYKEDQDYSYRCQLAGVFRVAGIPGCEADHVGSATLRSDPDCAAIIQRMHARNANYYKMKWGDDAGFEIFRHPYDNTQHDHTWWPHPESDIATT
jgi:GT2 family glycosyltransferase